MKIAAAAVFVAGIGIAFGLLSHRQTELAAYSRKVETELAGNRRLIMELKPARGANLTSDSNVSAKSEPKKATPSTVRGVSVRQRLLHTSEFAPFLRKEQLYRAVREYGEWFKQLTVTPDRLAVVRQAIADRIALSQDAFDAAIEAGYDTRSREFGELVMRYEKEAEAQLQRVLTKDEYASYQAHEKVRWFMTDELPTIRDVLGEHGAPPLSGDQVTALSTAWQAARDWNPDTPMKPGPLARARTAKVLDFVGSAVTPEQRAALADYVEYRNLKSKRLAELYHPQDPDAAVSSGMVVSR